MRIFVLGLGHLGTVYASALSEHFDVIAFDPHFDKRIHPYASQDDPGLIHGWESGVKSGRLQHRFSGDASASCDVIWVAIDTPLVNGVADFESVLKDAEHPLQYAQPNTVVVVSSQLPAGTMRRLSERFPHLYFACQPENLRVGRGWSDFKNPDRIVCGVGDSVARDALAPIFAKFTDKVLWMSIESAEWVKHAINSYLSMTIAFANEFGMLARAHGANLRDIERAMKSDTRIGPRAYLAYGDGPGDHLTRDVKQLSERAQGLFRAVEEAHARFEQRKRVA